MSTWIGVSEAANELGVNSARIRALISHGQLVGEKVGGRWLVDPASLRERARVAPSAGRPLSAKNAWMALLLASGVDLPKDVDSVARWRVRDVLRRRGVSELAARLRERASVQHEWALPEELDVIRQDSALIPTGARAAQSLRLGLMAGADVDGYIRASLLDRFKREHMLQESAAGEANVVLRVVPDDAWLLDGQDVAPLAAIALDLQAYPDSRARRIAAAALAEADEVAKSL